MFEIVRGMEVANSNTAVLESSCSIKLRIKFRRQWRGKPASAVVRQVVYSKTANLRMHFAMLAIRRDRDVQDIVHRGLEILIGFKATKQIERWKYR